MLAQSAIPRQRRWLSALVIVVISLAYALSASAQISQSEHEKHHPQGPPSASDGAGPPSGTGATDGTGPGMMGDMAKMMEHMGAPPPRELYPSLMQLPDLPPAQRAVVQQQAHVRMKAGAALMAEAIDALSNASATDNFSAMQQATEQLREGLSQYDSGLAAHRALAEGKAPRTVALQWFKREMNLLPPAPGESTGVFGLSWFHAFIMLVLIVFAVAMIGMYFMKMRRAAALLEGIVGPRTPARVAGAGAPKGAAPSTAAPLDAEKPRRWSGKLRVSRVFQETPDVKTFRLMNPLGGVMPFDYMPGQFLTISVPIDDKPVRRSYTIASSPTQRDYVEITVKHDDEGVVSGYLHERVQPGDLLDFSGPSGSFIFTGRECRCILLIGGGVGITPLMSVIRYLTDRSWPGDVYLIYSVSKPYDIIFRDELDHVQRRNSNLHVVVTVSHPEDTDWNGAKGRITRELIANSVPDIASRYVHICGPVPMMESTKKILIELGLPADRIKTEAFGPALGKPEPAGAATAAPPSAGGVKIDRTTLPVATFSLSEKSGPLGPDQTVLDVADSLGVDIDNSCRVGTCGTCRVKLLAGTVTMAVEDGLEPGDKENQIILACQAKSTENVTIEA